MPYENWEQCEECGEVSHAVTWIQVGDYEWESFFLCPACQEAVVHD